jgi:5-epi-alpha-selinene synthase
MVVPVPEIIKKLYIPFDFQECKFGIEAEKHMNDWVSNFGFFDNFEDERKFQSYGYSWLMVYAYPNAGMEEQFIVSDWNAWLFLLDDLNDTSEIGQDYIKLRLRFDYLLRLLRDRTILSREAQDPIAESMCELWSRICKYQPDIQWQERFINGMKEYFDACVWESRNRQFQIIPSQDDYIRNRYFSGAVYPSMDLGDITEKMNVPDEMKSHPILKEMTDLTVMHITLCNDLFSHGKEILQEEVHHNLVLQIAQQNQVTVEDAVNQVIERVNSMVERFLILKKELPVLGSNTDQDVSKFVGLLQSWIRGHVDWVGKKSQRYIVAHDAS